MLFRRRTEWCSHARREQDGHQRSRQRGKPLRGAQGAAVHTGAAEGQRMRPELFARADNFLFTKRDGRVLHRDVVAKHLSAAAVALGAPPGAAAVISLRSGGASAMWDTGMSAEEIKFRGRWASDCFKIYIWPGHDRSRNVAAKMLRSRTSRSWRRWQRTAATGSKRE